jgi:hypothetical protein
MKIFFTFTIVLLSFVRLYAQDKYPIRSVKSSSGLVRINTLRFKKIAIIDLFKASADSVFLGDEITLTWQTINTSKVTLEVSSNGKEYSILQDNLVSSGYFQVIPTGNLFYRIHADNNYKIVNVAIKEKPLTPVIEYFKVSKDKIKKGEKIRLNWLVKNVARITLEIGKTSENSIPYQDYLNEGFLDISPEKTIYYVLRVGEITKSLKVEVNQE